MYCFGGSFNINLMATEKWQKAFARSAFSRVEISSGDIPDDSVVTKVVKELAVMQENGTLDAVSLHLPFMPFEELNASSPDEYFRQTTVQYLTNFIRKFAPLHIPNITMHCSSEPVPADIRNCMCQALRYTCADLLPVLEETGASLNLELLPRSCIGNRVEELLAAVEGLPREHFGICLDVNHGMDRGLTVPDMIRQCGNRLKTCHISDYDNVDECHWNVGEGMLDWVAIRQALKDVQQEIILIFELNTLKTPEWKKYAPDPEFDIKNIERNCVFLEFAQEIELLRDKLRANKFMEIK